MSTATADPTATTPTSATSTSVDPTANGSTAPAASSSKDDDPLPTDSGPADIHGKLKGLRLDEVPALAANPTNLRTVAAGNSWIQMCFLETGRYLRFVGSTIVYVLTSFFFGGLGLFDFFSILAYAVGGIVVLGLVLVFCLAAQFPILVDIYFAWSNKFGGGLGLVNSLNPNLFKALTDEQAAAGKATLSASFKETGDTPEHRYFNLDTAKLLLQMAAVIYEHECDGIREAVGITSSAGSPSLTSAISAAVAAVPTAADPAAVLSTPPGQLLNNLFSAKTSTQAQSALATESDAEIHKFAAEFGLEFEPISELNSTSSAFCGLFWDPKSNWIVVSFKGTAPLEFGEWLSDLNTKMVDYGDWIKGFSKGHLGFKDRVFPQDVSALGGTTPYHTITMGIKTLAKYLHKSNGFDKDKKINVWFTGHSLGCATASLVYARALMNEKDLGKKAVLRDAYIFAAPILTDRTSVDIFNNKMFNKKKELKTMWRITSNADFVATGLPELGDYRNITVSPNNGFAFAHLGAEMILRDLPTPTNVSGNHFVYGIPVTIKSSFTAEQIAAQRSAHLAVAGEAKREQIGIWLQKIPLMGRFIAHCTVYYWDQLDRIGIGKAEWSSNLTT